MSLLKLAARACAVAALIPTLALAQGAVPKVKTLDYSGSNQAPNYCRITVTPTAAALSTLLATAGCAAIPSWATVAYLTPEVTDTVALRWRADGTAPTASVGDPIFGYTKDPSVLGYTAITNASLISATGANILTSVRIGG